MISRLSSKKLIIIKMTKKLLLIVMYWSKKLKIHFFSISNNKQNLMPKIMNN